MGTELLRAFILIFVAEMGDKSQILAMAFASKYKIRNVVIGLFFGILLNHTLAILLGSNLQYFVPLNTLSIIAGVMFIIFGLWSLLSSDSDETVKVGKFGPIITVAIAFFIGELGDKTQLTAITLSTDAVYPVIVLIGTVSGMVVTSLLGIYIGIKLGAKIPETFIKIGSSIVFIIVGFMKLSGSLNSTLLEPIYYVPVILVVFVLYTYLTYQLIQKYRLGYISSYQRTAEQLHTFYFNIGQRLETICLGRNHCGSCGGNNCLVGYTKNIVKLAREHKEIDISFYKYKEAKEFDREKLIESLWLTINNLRRNWEDEAYENVHLIRNNLERLILDEEIVIQTYRKYIKYIKNNYPELHKKHT